jgi:hypothetical protein
MIHSVVFNETNLITIQNNILQMLASCDDFDNKRIASSPRAVGDSVQEVIAENMASCFPCGTIKDFSDTFARRAMADVAFSDVDDNYFIVDIKTHNKDTAFNMPNLTSVERLSRFYEDDKNFFVVLLVEYRVADNKVAFEDVKLIPIEHFEWNCLTIGALGWGQIQIANASIIHINRDLTRKEWMLQLCDNLDIFYPKEIAKIERRIQYFEKVRKFWEGK